MIRIAHIIAIIFAVLMFIATLLLNKKKKLNLQATITWSFVWAGMIIATLLFDRMASFANKVLKIQTMDLFIITAIIILFIMSFAQFNQLKHEQKQIENIVSGIAMKDSLAKKEKVRKGKKRA